MGLIPDIEKSIEKNAKTSLKACPPLSTLDAPSQHPMPPRTPLGPYSRPMPRALWWTQGGGAFIMMEVPFSEVHREERQDLPQGLPPPKTSLCCISRERATECSEYAVC